MEELKNNIEKLPIKSQSFNLSTRRRSQTVLQNELGKCGFQIFECVCDLGYYGWKPRMGYKHLRRVDSNTIKSQVDVDAKPARLVALTEQRLPVSFQTLPPLEHPNKFPYGQYDIASLYVATRHRGLNLDDIDFVFGGSTLEMLARRKTCDLYMATKIPGTSTMLVVKSKQYKQNYADIGFQFEQFAEVDAVMDDEPVEITAAKSSYWGRGKMFQMISSGSPFLCHGVKKEKVLQCVKLMPLSEVSQKALQKSDQKKLENNILTGLKDLKSSLPSLQEGVVCEITLTPTGSLLPKTSIFTAGILPLPNLSKT